MLIKPEIERFAKIKVVGVGGAGGNVLNTLIESQQIVGVEYVAVNTDAQDLSKNKAFVKLPIGQEITNGLGSGANPEIGRKAAEESRDLIQSNLENSDMVFITAGMGGGTGTGAAPVVASIARELGALTVAVVTKPFNFEGSQRRENAENGLVQLKREVDALIIIPNQKLLEIADEGMSVIDAFRVSDSVLSQGVQGISDLIMMPGTINVDFADVKTVMKNAGSALMGIGVGTGEGRAVLAARAAISSPLLENNIDGAKGILFNVVGGSDLGMREVDDAARVINTSASPDANIIFGYRVDPSLNDQVKITVIATGFEQEDELIRSRMNLDALKRKDPEGLQELRPKTNKNEEVSTDKEKKQNQNIDDDSELYDIPAFLREN
ncbi:cell division protein FtsZ [Candidatus Nomurabacteria bacterium]|uniref:Cell division protein FtsZ n=1 Tax=candidate division WWE3 bacterium TaxID=2053526 RepID=A0A955E0W8_UNCKA|nr:cell division protein FtsZ [candidate division WWE3 bacterium]MCB9824093.1 cell division protein FtsZ [Candidatus Nomurabacteria bacterium]MCB9826936.1 cell division protein FtsZ [Candidatus Nomurabacteria bacterium]MCB9828034.1 cell division protein FtsZ [Candidatus Nomurabacteria bacterium]HXK52947.1 cell division protein FtsZ [bacterium]